MFLSKFTICLLILLPCAVGVSAARQKSESKKTAAVSPSSRAVLEVGHGSHVKATPPQPTELKLVSYNIRWRGGDDLPRLIKLFQEDARIGKAVILCLQEVDRNKKRTGKVNTVKVMAEALGMYYAWTAPPPAETGAEEETGVAILSLYPLTDIQPLLLPHEGPDGRRRVALGATVNLGGDRFLRIYSVHSETRIPVNLKLEQLNAVLDDWKRSPANMPAAILGDFNTWEFTAVGGTHKLFEQANFHTPFDDQPTFFRRIVVLPLSLKLDWIWVRNVSVLKSGIEREITLSDHWPLWAIVKLSRRSEKE